MRMLLVERAVSWAKLLPLVLSASTDYDVAAAKRNARNSPANQNSFVHLHDRVEVGVRALPNYISIYSFAIK